MENIINKIRGYYPVSDESLALLLSRLRRVVIPAKTTIIKANHIAKNVYFIEKGIARVYIMKGGEQVTTWFCLEGDVAYGALSIFRDKPCFEYVETLEDTEAYMIPVVELRNL